MNQFKCLRLLTSTMLITAALFLSAAAEAQTAPRIFASDLQSGPRSGGQGGNGAWVTVYGSGLGATRGTSTITVGGIPAASYAVWSDKKVAFQLSATAVSGNIVANVGGASSNGVPFTVRAGRIFFVSPTGSDTQKGTFAKPWKTLARAVAAMQAGDIAYAMNGTSATTLTINRAGTSGKPFAIVAYPNATVTVGSTAQNYAITASGGAYSWWVVSGLNLRAAVGAVNVVGATDWRLVGNDISCPSGSGAAACVRASSGSNFKVLANKVHDSGSTTSTNVASYSSVHLSVSNVEVGWNEIGNTRSCRALTFSSASGNLSGLSVHDNHIHDAVCDGISFANVDASAGAVHAYNNVIKRVGTGPAPGGVEQSYACIRAGGSGTGTVQILNNTLYDCGARGNGDSGAIAAATPVAVTNNIISVQPGQQFITPNTSLSFISGINDVFWGDSYIPAPFTSSINLDPQFVDAANSNLALQASSPAIDKGANTGVAADIAGVVRPQGKAIDIGAYEYSGTTTPGTGQLTLTPTALSFGTVTVGSSNTQTVTVSNVGSASVAISQMTVSGAGFSASGLSLPRTLSAGESASFTVTYTPQTAGNASGSVALLSNAATSTTTVQLSGSAVSPAGTLNVPSTLSFGSVAVGSSTTQNVTITASTASVSISQIAASGTGFSVSGLAVPTTLAAGQSATMAVKFAPTAAGTASGSISILSNASNSPNTISLTGSGASQSGSLTANPTTLAFGNVTVGASTTQNLTVTASTAPVTITQATVTGSGFSVSGVTLPVTLSPGQSATFQAKFTPTLAGTVSGSLSLVSNATNTPTSVALSGTGIAATLNCPCSIWSSSTVPPLVDANDSQAVELGVKFKSDVSGYITGIRYYKSSNNTGTHMGNLWTTTGTRLASATFTNETASGWQQVNFSNPVPITAGTVYIASYHTPSGHYANSQNYFASTGADNGPLHALQNSVSANGVYAYGATSSFPNQTWAASNYWIDVVFTTSVSSLPGTLAATPTSLSFGSVSVGSSSSKTVTLSASTSSVTISQANVTGAGFSVTGLTLPTTIAAGQSLTFAVRFAPTAAGTVNGGLSVVSNGSNSPLTIPLSGSGTSVTTAHSATVSWVASTSTNVVGYYVYRATQSGGPYTKLNSTAVTGTRYTDSNVVAGTTYYYVVTAVNSSGTQSAYSTQVAGTIPTP
ncbi:MAG TPA: choice-of-anchor D domain-containing protein [Terriglobales bacterium]|nr:choice-of-anchor D domain-containing protein [Terriglobales bacterium]